MSEKKPKFFDTLTLSCFDTFKKEVKRAMKKTLMTVMLLIAVLFVSNIAKANASDSKVVADAGDYRENSPC